MKKVCSDTSNEGQDGQKLFRICGIGSKTLPERLKPQSTKIKELWGALQALREFRNTLQGCDITFFTDNVGVVKLLGTGNWADASLPKCVANIVPVMETLHIKVDHLPNISRNKFYLKMRHSEQSGHRQ